MEALFTRVYPDAFARCVQRSRQAVAAPALAA
jgi:hypothetical protein